MNIEKIIEAVSEYAVKVGGAIFVIGGIAILLTNVFRSFFGVGIGALFALLGAMIIASDK